MKKEKIQIGIGHVVKALQLNGFGHKEIMAIRQFMLDNKAAEMGIGLRTFYFVDDCYSEDWEDNPIIIKEI